ncbi:MAG TPA: alpha/beta fold hydrolase [Gemmatimonadaceae bacterium]
MIRAGIIATLGLLTLANAAFAQAPAGTNYNISNFTFETGETFPQLRVHYYTFGRPTRDPSGHVHNAVLVVHGTTGSGAPFASTTFAGELFGPGQLLDTAKYYVIIPDAIGHGQSSKPSDGLRTKFPKYSYNDMVLAEHELLTRALDVDHLRLMIGTSMGCMHAWLWMERYPTFIDGAVPLACAPTEIAGRNRITRKLMIEYITSDPAYDGGNYKAEPIAGLREATAIMNLTGLSPKMFQKQAPTRAAADSVAMRTAHAESSPYDANDLIYAVDASRDYDPSHDLEKITTRVVAINSADDFINPPELGLMERLMPHVKHGRYVLLPITDETRGHGTHSLPAIWKPYLAQLLKELPQ